MPMVIQVDTYPIISLSTAAQPPGHLVASNADQRANVGHKCIMLKQGPGHGGESSVSICLACIIPMFTDMIQVTWHDA